jgi:methionyl-tRNA formyltransferase
MNIYILLAAATGIDLIEIIKNKINIKGVIGLSNRNPSDSISGFVYMQGYCKENNLNFIPVDSYNLKDKKDIEKLSELDIDILILGPWGRLIPNWLIDQCKVGAIGIHGSSYGITGGRGRAPENWALILGEETFSISIFKVDPGVDSGDVLDTKTFDISLTDDILSTRYKMIWNVGQMIIKLLTCNHSNFFKGQPQIEDCRYLPQRIPADGELDWQRSAKEIYNFIRAITRPYPGAYSKLNKNGQILFWEASPLEGLPNIEKFQPGEIISRPSSSSQLLIKTGKGALFVTQYELRPESLNSLTLEGHIFKSANFYDQCNEIFQRHYNKYPDKTIQEKITEFAENYSKRSKTSIAINK